MTSPQSAWNGRKKTIFLPDRRPLTFLDTGGNGPVLLLLHGYSDSSRSFSLMAPALGSFRLLIPDLSGHGGSAAGGALGVEALADDIGQLLAALDIRHLAMTGHSMGAMIGIVLAARLGSCVSSLATISGALRPDFPADGAIARGISALSDPIAPSNPFFDDWHACALPVDPDFLAYARREAAAMPAPVWHAILKAFSTTDLSAAARTITAPVLCIAGSQDPLFGTAHRAAMAGGFAHARSVVLKGHGHNPHWEDPARIASLLKAFLEETMQPVLASSRIL
ncbi:alpha/beta fold hydrolase [Pararhizobium sp.]|uniref:alpha/beta fold hydrolase n=1 Tax=Pararhizobium sp. TaxID=1977563 RepID=UPI002717C10F|nr:alpha/beta hydrolase [Pararhizobium sp.]MDO9417197.1 alpha/beta hydrolase [Pararhizobium sp.]